MIRHWLDDVLFTALVKCKTCIEDKRNGLKGRPLCHVSFYISPVGVPMGVQFLHTWHALYFHAKSTVLVRGLHELHTVTSSSLSVFPLVFLGFYFKNVVCVCTYMTIYMADLSGRYWNISVLTTVIWRHHFQVGWDYHVNLDELLIRSGKLYIFCQNAVIFAKSQYSKIFSDWIHSEAYLGPSIQEWTK